MRKLSLLVMSCILLLNLAACGTAEGAGGTSASSESASFAESPETSSETEAAEPSLTTEAEEAEIIRSFGRPVADSFIAEVNRKTAENEGSGVVDVLGDISSFTKEKAVALIEAYTLPEKEYYGDAPVTEELKGEISGERNLEALKAEDDFELRFGILTVNADVRGFPTDLRATDTGGAEEYDYFQETKLLLGSGVLVLHSSLSGEYSFVQGCNYNGWVKTSGIAFCDYDEFRSYLTPDSFLVCVKPDQDVPERRLGEVLPVVRSDESGTAVLLPKADESGRLFTEELLITPEILSEYYHEGFLDWSEEACAELMRSLLGFPYGWGDTGNAYDCSSTIGSVYACFGFVLPRNTGIMKYFGVHSEDVEGKTFAELKRLIASHPSAILIFKGHALMSCGIRTSDDGTEYLSIVHNTKGWYVRDGEGLSFRYQWCVTDSCPEEMLRADGTMTLDYLTRIIWVE